MEGPPEACRERGARPFKPQTVLLGWRLSVGVEYGSQRERGEEELYPWSFDFIELEGARVFPEAQLREWAHSQARRRSWGITPKGVVLGEPWFVLGE
jgi:hypothetical protein